MDRRDEEALVAAETAEKLDLSSIDAKLSTIRILLNYVPQPARARAKAEEVVNTLSSDDHFTYGALALLGTARARCGDVDGAVAVFREMTTPEMLDQLRSAEYVGVFDLQVVSVLED